ncbi:MAG: hypothetical protein ACTSW4_00370 [Candidatus Ranarchaeia archaeon]
MEPSDSASKNLKEDTHIRRLLEREMILQQFFDFDWTMGGRRERVLECFDVDEGISAKEFASMIDEKDLETLFRECGPYSEKDFLGEFYTVVDGNLRIQGSWNAVREKVWMVLRQYGREAYAVLRAVLDLDKPTFTDLTSRASQIFGSRIYPTRLIHDLAYKWGILRDVGRDNYSAWEIPKERRVPVGEVLDSCGLTGLPRLSTKIARLEYETVLRSTQEFDSYVGSLIENRFEETLHFGKFFTSKQLDIYLATLFGDLLYFDILLAITQQYGLANIPIINERGSQIMRTGFNLALFGEPGTGKTFAVDDMIRGNLDRGIPAHGLPGRNRYCGGMTAARFIRLAEAYDGIQFNFIIPEFNDWFRYSGMVEPLKLAMEQREIKYEIKDEVIGPYKVNSFFSVNYNTKVVKDRYRVTISDPNFNAIEDRMLCRLSSLSRERFDAIAESQRRLLLGKLDMNQAQAIRDHLTLMYATQNGHPLIPEDLLPKKVLLTEHLFNRIVDAREKILDKYPDVVPFSPRLESRALKLACALSTLTYFSTPDDVIEIQDHAIETAIKFYSEECEVRSLAIKH